MLRRTFILSAPALAAACAPNGAPEASGHDQSRFVELLHRLAEHWNAGNARLAAECFTPDAIYVEPPQKQVHIGREALFTFFGGSAGRPGAMSMQWHRTMFDAHHQQGMGEFTFRYGSQVHGVALMDVRNGLISQWREYWYSSELPFHEFVAPGRP